MILDYKSKKKNIVFFDTETTGLITKKSMPKLLEIFLMRCDYETLMPVSYLHMMSNPEMKIPEKAQKVNNIKQSWVDRAPVQSIVLSSVRKYINKDDVLCGSNIDRYDMKIIQQYGITYDNETYDIVKLAKQLRKVHKFGFTSNGQEAMFKHFFLDEHSARLRLEEKGLLKNKSHRADVDVKDCRRVFIELEKLYNKYFIS